jgi:hypothetical protein
MYSASVTTIFIILLYQTNKQIIVFIFIFAPCILKILLLSHSNKCINYIIYYLTSVLIIDIKTLSYFHNSYVFRQITCHPQGALVFLAKITGKIMPDGTVAHTARMHTRIHDILPHPSYNICSCFTNCFTSGFS